VGQIRVRFYGAFCLIPDVRADKARLKQGIVLPLAKPMRVREVLDRFEIPIHDVHLLLIGKVRVTLDAALKDGDTLHIFPMMAGG
jgi:molybdopterin converting factor small subunit